MDFKAWFKKRGLKFISQRAKKLSGRYGITPNKAVERIRHSVIEMGRSGCKPTFFVPAIVVNRNLSFIRELQGMGCEIGVHGYQHVDLKNYPPAQASLQLSKAKAALLEHGLQVHGFRCPYLSISDGLIQAVPEGLFQYSSNRSVELNYPLTDKHGVPVMFETIQTFYQPVSAEAEFCLPWMDHGMVEIPVCVPDDLQLHDGLQYSLEEISSAWVEILEKTHQRGELFNLMFHPELVDACEAPFLDVLQQARQPEKNIWVTQLRDVCDWWLEKQMFSVSVKADKGFSYLDIQCSSRATVLCRGAIFHPPFQPWDQTWNILPARQVQLADGSLPLIHLQEGIPDWVRPTLTRLGYIAAPAENGGLCSLQVDIDFLNGIANPVQLEQAIENSSAPLIRFWSWPDGCHSALCLTGDLDALSLVDYASRLLPG